MNTNINLEEYGATIVGMMAVGSILKNAFPSFPNRLIPLVTWVLGVAAYLAMSKGWGDPQQWLAGIITAASATGLHSATKNTIQTSAPVESPKP